MRLAAILQALVALRRSLSTGLPILQFLAEIAYYTIQDTLFVFFCQYDENKFGKVYKKGAYKVENRMKTKSCGRTRSA